MIGFLSLPIRLLGIVLMAAFCFEALSPLRTLHLKLSALIDPNGNPVATVTPATEHPSLLLSLGLSLVAIVSVWVVYQTYRQHIALAEGELRNRRAAKKQAG